MSNKRRCEVCELLEDSPSHAAGMCTCSQFNQCHCRFTVSVSEVEVLPECIKPLPRCISSSSR